MKAYFRLSKQAGITVIEALLQRLSRYDLQQMIVINHSFTITKR